MKSTPHNSSENSLDRVPNHTVENRTATVHQPETDRVTSSLPDCPPFCSKSNLLCDTAGCSSTRCAGTLCSSGPAHSLFNH